MKKALVTGAAGFIGSSLSLRLLDEGWNVTALDNLSTGRREFLNEVLEHGGATFVTSYGSAEACAMIAHEQFDVIFHVGAVPRVAYSVEHPAETELNNVYETLKMLEACRDNVGRVVFSSSSSVLGGAPNLTFPTNEDYPKQPASPYAIQKSTVEDYLRNFSNLYGLDTVSLRYFNVYGPRQYGDSPYSTVISAWCQALKDGRSLRLDGTGEQSRDFCYIDNVLDANILAATAKHKFNGMPINIAHGEEHSLRQIMLLFEQKFGKLNIVNADWRAGDVMRTWADISLAREVLGYDPHVDFNTGLERTWDWWGF